MAKVLLGPSALIYPMPALLVGANVEGKANFTTVAWGGICNSTPPTISIALNHIRHTLKGIRENMTFSVNVPSVKQVKETDYCGIISGSKADKTKVCKFKVFYGKLGNAPLIEQCPVNLECKVIHLLDLGSHTLVVGRIEETHVSTNCLTDGKPDFRKINPLLWVTAPALQYCSFGDVIAKAFSVGKELISDK